MASPCNVSERHQSHEIIRTQCKVHQRRRNANGQMAATTTRQTSDDTTSQRTRQPGGRTVEDGAGSVHVMLNVALHTLPVLPLQKPVEDSALTLTGPAVPVRNNAYICKPIGRALSVTMDVDVLMGDAPTAVQAVILKT